MRKRILRTLVILLMLVSLTGCGIFTMAGKFVSGLGKDRDVSEEEEPAVTEPDPEPSIEPEGDPELPTDPENPEEEPDPAGKILPFVYGTSSVYDTRTWEKLSFGMPEDQKIISAISRDGNYYIHTANDIYSGAPEDDQCFYILNGEGELTAVTPVDPGEDTWLFDCVPYDGRFYYHVN
nr:hypothetical protein [Lachnospiraceae bacterium]